MRTNNILCVAALIAVLAASAVCIGLSVSRFGKEASLTPRQRAIKVLTETPIIDRCI